MIQRLLIFLFLFIITVCSHAQQEQRNFGIAEVFRSGDSIFIKKLVTQVINVSEGTVTKFRTPPDTAKLFLAPDGGVYEGVITWRKVGGVVVPPVDPLPDLITDIDDKASDTRNKYTLVWTPSVNAPWNANHFDKTASYTLVKDGALETTFDGYKVEWFTEKRFNHGIAAVSIDGGPEVMVDLYDARTDNPSLKVWTSPVLTSGIHKIKIRCTLTKSNTSTGTDTNIIHDYFRTYKKQ